MTVSGAARFLPERDICEASLVGHARPRSSFARALYSHKGDNTRLCVSQMPTQPLPKEVCQQSAFLCSSRRVAVYRAR